MVGDMEGGELLRDHRAEVIRLWGECDWGCRMVGLVMVLSRRRVFKIENLR